MSDTTTTPESNAPPSSEVTSEAVTTETPTPAPAHSPAAQHALRALMDREKAVRTQESQVKAQAAELQRLQEQIRLQQEPPKEVEPTQANASQIARLEQELAQFKQQEAEYRNQVVLSEEKERVRSAVSSAEGLDAVKALKGGSDAVFERIVQHYNTTGEYLSEAQAAASVNKELVELYDQLHAVLGAQSSPQKPAESMDMLEVAKTLNASMTSESGSQSTANTLSEADINRKAAELLRFKTR